MAELRLQRTGDTLLVSFGEHSAAVPWAEIAPNEQTWQRIYDEADAYGRDLFARIAADEGLRTALLSLRLNERLSLLIDDPEVAIIPWEYLRDAENMLLASRFNVVRYVPSLQPSAPQDLAQPLTIVAIPVSPVDEPRVLNTEREWRRLVEAVTPPQKALT